MRDEQFKPQLLDLSPDARDIWIKFANHIEMNIGEEGALHQIPDAGSKTPENVARMAALFHIYQGRTGSIQADSIKQAILICEWYLLEFRRLFVPLPQITEQELDAQSWDFWFRQQYLAMGQYTYQLDNLHKYAPTVHQAKKRLLGALEILQNWGQVQVLKEPHKRTWTVIVNIYSTNTYSPTWNPKYQMPSYKAFDSTQQAVMYLSYC
jgi:hypothetical protein